MTNHTAREPRADPTPQVQGQARGALEVVGELLTKAEQEVTHGRTANAEFIDGCVKSANFIVREALARDTQVQGESARVEGAPDCRPLRGIPSDTLRYELDSRARSIASCQDPAQPDPEGQSEARATDKPPLQQLVSSPAPTQGQSIALERADEVVTQLEVFLGSGRYPDKRPLENAVAAYRSARATSTSHSEGDAE